MQVVGPGCSHRPLERNLPALGIDPLPAFLRFPASGSFETEGLSAGAQAGLEVSGHTALLRALEAPACLLGG